MSQAPAPNAATLKVRNGPLVGAILGRVVGMLAARAQCPIDRLDDALLITDAVAAHAPDHAIDGRVVVIVDATDERLQLDVGPLHPDGAKALLAQASLPGVGNVLERVADEVEPAPGHEAGTERLLIRLRFAT
jgi:serine/threonine-protein kinase RsbW